MASNMFGRSVSQRVVVFNRGVCSCSGPTTIVKQTNARIKQYAFRRLDYKELHLAGALQVAYFYNVTFETGDRFAGGTDANVFIKLIGEHGITDEIHVPTKKGDLERGMKNTFEIAADDVGPLKRVFVRHDNSGLGPAWFLNKITVENHSGNKYAFNCNDWLRVDKTKGKLGLVKSVLEEKVREALGEKTAAQVEADTTFDDYTSMTEDKVHKKLTQVLAEVIGDEEQEEKDSNHAEVGKATQNREKSDTEISISQTAAKNAAKLHKAEDSFAAKNAAKMHKAECSVVAPSANTAPSPKKKTQKPKQAKKDRVVTSNTVDGLLSTTQRQHENTKLLSTQSSLMDIPLMPAVRLLLETHGLPRELIHPTGPKGRILKGDVLNFLKSGNTAADVMKPRPETKREGGYLPKKEFGTPGPIPVLNVNTEADFFDIPNSNVRKTIASRLTVAKTSIPHSYAALTCNVSGVSNLRRQLKKDGIALTVNDFVVKAVAMALKTVPQMNAQWDGETVLPIENVDVSIAVATDKGLITPIVRDADQLELTALSKAVQGLVQKAREGRLAPQEYQGGTFTVSNLGMYGLTHFSAIINPPQTCIMAVGGTQLSLSEDGSVNSHITVTLSYDGRALSEETTSDFLEKFKAYLENPFAYLAT